MLMIPSLKGQTAIEKEKLSKIYTVMHSKKGIRYIFTSPTFSTETKLETLQFLAKSDPFLKAVLDSRAGSITTLSPESAVYVYNSLDNVCSLQGDLTTLTVDQLGLIAARDYFYTQNILEIDASENAAMHAFITNLNQVLVVGTSNVQIQQQFEHTYKAKIDGFLTKLQRGESFDRQDMWDRIELQ